MKKYLSIALVFALFGAFASITGCTATAEEEPEFVDNPADAPPGDAPVKSDGVAPVEKGANRGGRGG